jgi:hypothetical protein
MILGLLSALAMLPTNTVPQGVLSLYESRLPDLDWLIDGKPYRAKVCQTATLGQIALTNGLVTRCFQLGPNFATVAMKNEVTGENLLRTSEPEAIFTIDGAAVTVGGLVGQPDRAFLLPEWLPTLKAPEGGLVFQSYTIQPPETRVEWTKARHASPSAEWPPRGVQVVFHFASSEKAKPMKADVHYELYDGVPIFAKWVTLHNSGNSPLILDSFVLERLGLVEPESVVDTPEKWSLPPITVATDYSFGGMALNASNRTSFWEPDPLYSTQVNYDLKTPCILEVKPPLGPSATLLPGATFSTFHAFELLQDSSDRERKGLATRKMFRILAPWCTENPTMLHLTSTDPKVVRTAIDQAAEVGFEMIIFSFGSGLDMEDVSPQNLAKFREFHEYAKSKGLEMGGYSLLASRHIDDENDAINPKTGKPGGAIFGYSPCLGSRWGLTYFEHLKTFMSATGFELLEHDGSYPGDVCASTTHPGHTGLKDSQWNQFQIIASFYRWCREKGIYLNVPDNYFFTGSNKTGMGYRETNWSLPRALQHLHARQNLFDGTWEKTPSMGWMMVPLVEYQGGGAAATIEPLKNHLQDYGLHLANNFGYGAQACYRGSRLYDSPETEAVVKKWVSWFKSHRDILESDVIHLRRADGSQLDGIVHVNPALPTKALAVIYNPTKKQVTEQVEVPLYYSGLRKRATIVQEEGKAFPATLSSEGNVVLKVKVAPQSCTWFTFQ